MLEERFLTFAGTIDVRGTRAHATVGTHDYLLLGRNYQLPTWWSFLMGKVIFETKEQSDLAQRHRRIIRSNFDFARRISIDGEVTDFSNPLDNMRNLRAFQEDFFGSLADHLIPKTEVDQLLTMARGFRQMGDEQRIERVLAFLQAILGISTGHGIMELAKKVHGDEPLFKPL